MIVATHNFMNSRLSVLLCKSLYIPSTHVREFTGYVLVGYLVEITLFIIFNDLFHLKYIHNFILLIYRVSASCRYPALLLCTCLQHIAVDRVFSRSSFFSPSLSMMHIIPQPQTPTPPPLSPHTPPFPLHHRLCLICFVVPLPVSVSGSAFGFWLRFYTAA